MATTQVARPEYDEHGNVVGAASARPEYDEQGNVVSAASTHVGALPTGSMQSKPSGPISSPQGEIMPEEVRQRHIRSSIGKLTPEQVSTMMANEPQRGLEGAGSRLVEGMSGLGKSMAAETATYGPAGPPVALGKALWGAQVGEARKARETTGFESAGHRLASGIPIAGPMAASAGEILGRGDWGGMSEALQALLTGKGLAKSGPKLPSAVDYDLGMKAIDNSWQFGGWKMLRDSVLRAKNEVETHVQNITQADRAANTRTGVPGTYSAKPALDLLTAQLGKYDPAAVAVMPHTTPIRLMLQDHAGSPLPFEVFKDLRSRVGRAWAEATKSKNAREAGVLDDVYTQMGDQMKGNTRGIGVENSFKQYNKLHRQVTAAEHGPIGDALKNDPNPQVNPNANGADFWGKLHDPEMQRVVRKGLEDLRAYGLPQKFFDLMDKEVKPIYDTVTNKGKFDFKTRLALAGTFAMMGIGRPFLTAYAAMYLPQIMKMARAAIAERALGRGGLPAGAMFTPPIAPGIGPTPNFGGAAPGIPGLSDVETPGGEPFDEAMRRGAPGAPPAEPTPASAKEATDVEAAKRKQATSEAAMSKADVAKKVAEARGSRSTSGVWKGKR